MAKRTRRPSSSPDAATAYARSVVEGETVAGPHVRATCERHLRDLEEGAARGLTWDLEAADRALRFFPAVLRLSEGQFEGEPFNLHPAQAFIVGSVFGWKRADGTRRFRRAYVEQGKGNGKSPLAGGIGLYGMMADGEPGAQVFAAAAKMEQARILFNDAVSMVRQSPALAEKITPSGINPVNNLADMARGSFFRPVGRDTGKTGSGMRPHFVLLDELHEHPNRDTLEMLERGFKFRRQPLIFMITNSGSDRNSVCREEHEHAVKVAHGEVEDDTTFSYVCALDEEDDPLDDPSCWIKANPLLGVTITEGYLADCAAQAKAIPGKANNIRRLHFCQWTDADTAWISRDAWLACEDEGMAIEEFAGRECFVGLDLGATSDLTARAAVFRDGEDEEGRPCYALFCRGYTPADTMTERGRRDGAPYDLWAEQGWLHATPGPIIRLDHVAAALWEFAQDHVVEAVAYDRWLIRDFEADLAELGVTLPLIEHPQGFNRRKDSPLWMPDSVNAFEQLILERRIRIEPNPALRTAVMGTTFVESPAGLRRFDKQRATTRIDMAVASAMAVGAAASREPVDTLGPTPWDADPNFSLVD